MITLGSAELTAGREQGQVEHDFLRLWGLVVGEQPSFVPIMALNFFSGFVRRLVSLMCIPACSLPLLP